MPDYHELVVVAKRSDDEHKVLLEKQRQADTRIVFGSQIVILGNYEPSLAVQKQLDQIADIQKASTEAIAECLVRF